MEPRGCNISDRDAYIRYILSVIAAFLSIHFNCYLLLVIAMVLAFTAARRTCYIYRIFNRNNVLNLTNYYQAELPKHNPSPVYIFGEQGGVLFANSSAKEMFDDIKFITDITTDYPFDLIYENGAKSVFYKYGEMTYQVNLVGSKKDSSIYAYFHDVTEVFELNDEIENTQKEVIYAMGEIGESRSKETGSHVRRVANYSKVLALKYGLSTEESEILKTASPMHDIGKIAIPDAILNKPGKHTPEEFAVMQTHAQLGFDMLKGSNKPILKAAAIVAGEHHEKWDGSGYPNGKSGEDIHIYGRITAVADVFDALGSDRVYKKAWELEKILELFRAERGKHFDPKLVDIFFDNLDEILEIRDRLKD